MLHQYLSAKYLLVGKVENKDSQSHVTAVTSLLGCYTLLISKYFRTFRKIVLFLSSGSSRPRGVTKFLRDDTLLSLLAKDKRGLLLCTCEVVFVHGVMGIATLTVLFLPHHKKRQLKWQFFMHVSDDGAEVAVMFPSEVKQQNCTASVVTLILNTL
jgi:hypothetical protein